MVQRKTALGVESVKETFLKLELSRFWLAPVFNWIFQAQHTEFLSPNK